MPDLVWLAKLPALMTRASSDYDLNSALRPDATKEAAVLVAFDPDGHLLLTRRASHLKHHAGQIAFPGGRRDAEDADLNMTALREAREEVGLRSEHVSIIGTLPTHDTVTGYRMTPILARCDLFEPTPEPGEVAEVFRVPACHVLDPRNYRIEQRRWKGDWRRYYTCPWGPYYIWGATARILFALAEAADEARG